MNACCSGSFCLHGAGVQKFLSSGMKLILSLLSSGSWVPTRTPEMDQGIQTSTCSQLLESWGESQVEILHEYLCLSDNPEWETVIKEMWSKRQVQEDSEHWEQGIQGHMPATQAAYHWDAKPSKGPPVQRLVHPRAASSQLCIWPYIKCLHTQWKRIDADGLHSLG